MKRGGSSIFKYRFSQDLPIILNQFEEVASGFKLSLGQTPRLCLSVRLTGLRVRRSCSGACLRLRHGNSSWRSAWSEYVLEPSHSPPARTIESPINWTEQPLQSLSLSRVR